MAETADGDEASGRFAGLPRQRVVALAARAAMRVLPALGQPADAAEAMAMLQAVRAVLCAGVAAAYPGEDLSRATRAARKAADAAAREIDAPSKRAAIHAAARAAAAATHAEPQARARSAASAAQSADAASTLVSAPAELERDMAYADPLNAPLWPTTSPLHSSPPQFRPEGVSWSFWRRWHAGAVDGRPLDWDLQRRVATIPDADWARGPDHVAGLIAMIERQSAPPPMPPERVAAQARLLAAHPEAARMTAEGVAQTIEEAITLYMREAAANALPPGFDVLERLPSVVRAVGLSAARAASSQGTVAELEARIAEMAAEIRRLEADLATARAATGRGAFTRAFCEQAGRSLGDWKLWASVTAGAYMMIGAPSAAETMEAVTGMVRGIFGGGGALADPADPPMGGGGRA